MPPAVDVRIEEVRIGSADLTPMRRLVSISWSDAVAREARGLIRHRFALQMLVATQLAVRYQRNVLGFMWTFLNPLLLLGVQTIVFSQILHMEARTYAVYLFSGLLAWQFFSSSIQNASTSLIGNEGLIRRVATPLIVFPLTELLLALTNSGAVLLALLALVVAFGHPFHVQIVLLVPGILLLVLFTAGVCLATMALTTFFRDIGQIISVALFAGYFLTPVLYPPTAVNGALFRLNPLSYFLEFFHDALVDAAVLTSDPTRIGGLWPAPETWLIAVSWSVVSLIAGYVAYKVNEGEFVFRL